MDKMNLISTIQNTEHIGTFPSVIQWIMTDMDEPDFTMEKLCERLSRDSTVCSQILKIANSPYFYRGNRITSLFHAIIQIGSDYVKRILLAVQLIGLYRGNQDFKGFNHVDYWKHTLAGASIVEELAKKNRHINGELCFLCGILRNIGVPFVRQFFPDLFSEILHHSSYNHSPFYDSCKSVLGLDHRHIAYLICIRWNLPREIYWAIRGNRTTVPEVNSISEMISIADAILSRKQYSTWDKYYPDLISEELCGKYSVDQEFETSTCPEILDRVDRLSKEIFNVTIH